MTTPTETTTTDPDATMTTEPGATTTETRTEPGATMATTASPGSATLPGPAGNGAAGPAASGTIATTTSAAASAGRPFDPAALRSDFPLLAHPTPSGRPLVYLDSAATSQKPAVVIEAIDRFYRQTNANVHRGIYDLSERATADYEGARATLGRFINAPEPAELVFTRNATEAINLVAGTWGRRNINRGDAIVLTEMEHHANLVPWQLLVQERDGDLEFIPITDDGILRLEVLEVLLRL